MARILVVDDDTALLDMARVLLEKQGGHEAVLSADGEEALAIARENPPDLAIIDVMMPGMTGYELCRQLRASPETAAMPILVLTARGQPVDRAAALEVGADEHVAKPFEMSDLLDRVNELLEWGATAARSRIVVLLGLRGGVGVTTLAVNLAATLLREGRDSVCLVDLCPSSGHVALQLGLRPEPNWKKLASIATPDADAVEGALMEHRSGLRVLASPIVPVVGEGLPRSTVETVLGTLRERFEIVVVDTPSVLGGATMAALEAATNTWLVMAAEPASIQTVLGTGRALGEQADAFSVILNQAAPGQAVSPRATEQVLKRRLAGNTPFDPGQAQALARGQPLAFGEPDSPLAKAMNGLVKTLI